VPGGETEESPRIRGFDLSQRAVKPDQGLLQDVISFVESPQVALAAEHAAGQVPETLGAVLEKGVAGGLMPCLKQIQKLLGLRHWASPSSLQEGDSTTVLAATEARQKKFLALGGEIRRLL
jgi:hypothetical protein